MKPRRHYSAPVGKVGRSSRWRLRGLPSAAKGPTGMRPLVPLVIPGRLHMNPRAEARQADGVDWGPAPVDFFHTEPPDTGERRLLLAVLTDGISACFVPRARGGKGEQSRAQREALSWVGSMETGRISFRFACEALGIEPTRVQRAILARVVR